LGPPLKIKAPDRAVCDQGLGFVIIGPRHSLAGEKPAIAKLGLPGMKPQ
jgi:hypothetical protein